MSSATASPAMRAGRLLTDVLILGVLIHMMFLGEWLSRGVDQLAQRRAGAALVMHAVMRASVKDEAAASLASRCIQRGAGISARVIGPAEARGMLALQEPWMSELPDVEISRLPTLLEVRIAPSGIEAANIRALQDWLSHEPDIEFVVFNDTGLEDLLNFTSNVDWYAGKVRDWIVLMAAIALALFAARTSTGRPVRLARAMFVPLAAIALAYAGVQVLAASTRAHYDLGVPTLSSLLRDIFLAAAIWTVLSTLVPLIRARSGRGSAG